MFPTPACPPASAPAYDIASTGLGEDQLVLETTYRLNRTSRRVSF